MSPPSINAALDKVGEDYSAKLIRKHEEISSYLSKESDLKHTLEKLNVKLGDPDNTTREISHEDVSENLKKNREKVKCELDALAKDRPSSYCVVLDNIDMRLEGSDITSDNQHKDIHWCNHNAIIDRVNPTGFSDQQPIADIAEVDNKLFLPTLEEHNALINDFIVLVGRVFVENYDFFDIFKDIVPAHIKHKYSEKMKTPTDKVTYIMYCVTICMHACMPLTVEASKMVNSFFLCQQIVWTSDIYTHGQGVFHQNLKISHILFILALSTLYDLPPGKCDYVHRRDV